MTGASSADSRSSASSPSSASSSSSTASVTARLERVEPADQRLDVVGGGDRDAAVEAGDHLDVVDREHVRGVGDRHEQRLRVDVADRDRLVAARGGDREQVGRAHVDVEGVEVEVVEAVALGDRARELVGVDQLLLDQQLVGRAAGDPRLAGSTASTRSRVA